MDAEFRALAPVAPLENCVAAALPLAASAATAANTGSSLASQPRRLLAPALQHTPCLEPAVSRFAAARMPCSLRCENAGLQVAQGLALATEVKLCQSMQRGEEQRLRLPV